MRWNGVAKMKLTRKLACCVNARRFFATQMKDKPQSDLNFLEIKEIPHCISGNNPIRVWLCTHPSHVDRWIKHNNILESGVAVGVDCEWKPNGGTKVSILQVATVDSVMIVYMHRLAGIVPSKLQELMISARNNKVGVAIETDLQRLHKEYGLKYNGHVDIGFACNRIFARSVRGLANICKFVLNFDMPKLKRLQLSDWNRFPLTMDQMTYAAYDALVGICVYRQICHLHPVAMSVHHLHENDFNGFNLYIEEGGENMSKAHSSQQVLSRVLTEASSSAQELFERSIRSSRAPAHTNNRFDPRVDNVMVAQPPKPANAQKRDEILPLFDRSTLVAKFSDYARESPLAHSRFSTLIYNSDMGWIQYNQELLISGGEPQGMEWPKALTNFFSRLGWVLSVPSQVTTAGLLSGGLIVGEVIASQDGSFEPALPRPLFSLTRKGSLLSKAELNDLCKNILVEAVVLQRETPSHTLLAAFLGRGPLPTPYVQFMNKHATTNC